MEPIEEPDSATLANLLVLSMNSLWAAFTLVFLHLVITVL
jgi:hypothetical protein